MKVTWYLKEGPLLPGDALQFKEETSGVIFWIVWTYNPEEAEKHPSYSGRFFTHKVFN